MSYSSWSELEKNSQKALGYNEYLKVPELLNLQHPLSQPTHHDELLFIIIHQSYELWFKLIIHELETTVSLMNQKELLRARHYLNRSVEILNMLIPQIHILETMTPVDFLHFRDNLKPASGFQSAQFREVEFMAGLKDARYLKFFDSRPELKARLENRLGNKDLGETYVDLLRNLGLEVPTVGNLEYLEANPGEKAKLIAALKPLYQEPEKHLPLYLLTESLVDLDEALGMWRDHHVRVVERVIGFKQGTGGSAGSEYLRQTLRKQCFPYLWQVRTELELRK